MTYKLTFDTSHFSLSYCILRLTGGDELHSEVHVAPLSYHTVGFFHGYYLLHYGIGAVQVQNAQDLLLHWHKFSINCNRKYCTLMHQCGTINNCDVKQSRIGILCYINKNVTFFIKGPIIQNALLLNFHMKQSVETPTVVCQCILSAFLQTHITAQALTQCMASCEIRTNALAKPLWSLPGDNWSNLFEWIALTDILNTFFNTFFFINTILVSNQQNHLVYWHVFSLVLLPTMLISVGRFFETWNKLNF